MAKSARAIILEDNKILIMHRRKQNSEYYTLVGGQVGEHESIEQALRREVKEETGLHIKSARLVFIENHPVPYRDQYVYLCDVDNAEMAAIQETSEEALLNRIDINVHTLAWVETRVFSKIPFFTMNLQQAIVEALETGFPAEPKQLG